MHLVLVTALIAVCGGDKLDRTYLPPASANTAGGSPGSLQAPFRSYNQGLGGLPKGGYSNEFEGVVVDAAASGTRASGGETGLGGPRIAYGSTDSKVGEAAFTADTAFPRVGIHARPSPGSLEPGAHSGRSERVQASRDRTSNTVKYENDVNHDSFNYAFETDNGIVAEENGVEVNGVKAQGGYSYTGDDGQVYSVTYTADEGGYRPRGDHLPTPPPIPQEILKSLEQNAKEEASGIVDDGSYDAQKYNTGEDYAKTDGTNGKYNGQPIRLGNRPQSDADASSSFINQNNQYLGATSSVQFGSNPGGVSSSVVTGFNSFGSGVNAPSTDSQKTTQKGQTIGFGSGTNNEYLPPYSGFTQNRRPGSNNRPQEQNNQQNGFLQGTAPPGANNNDDANKDQSSQIPTFIPLSQQKLQGDSSKKPSTPIFGKPTIIDSSLSIKDPFARRPSGNKFNQNKQPSQKPLSQVGGSFEVVSGNVYSSKNEYLPPHRQLNKNKGNQGFQHSSFGTQPNQQPTGSTSQTYTAGPTSPSASAFASVSRPTSGLQSFQQYNSQQSPQYAGSNPSSSLNQFTNSRIPSNNNQPQFSTGLSNSPLSPTNQYKPSSFASQSPTLVPQTVLTTPLQSSFDKNKGSIPGPVIDGPDSSSGISSSNLPSFGARPSNSFFGHSSFNSDKVKQVAPTQASVFASSSLGGQSSPPGRQNVPQSGLIGNFGGQFSNKSPNDGQYSPSTQRPSYNQNTQQQGADDSYIYNTPSKAFNVPTARPQFSSFPSSSFDQSFKVTQTPFATRPQPSSFQTSFSYQSNKPVGSTKFPTPSTLEPVSPTLPSFQAGQNGDSFQSQFNKVTQASASSFPSPVPTASAGFHQNQFSQFGTRPSQVTNSQFSQKNQGQPGSTFSQTTATLPGTSNLDSTPNSSSSSQKTQQYGGELYEYNKPPQSLPVPQTGVTPGQFGSSSIIPQPATQNSEAYKPSTQFGSKFTQQTVSPFGQSPQNSQQQSESRPGLFGSLSSRPTQNTQFGQGNEPFKSNTQKQPQSETRPESFGSQPTYTQNQEFNFNNKPQNQPQTNLPSGQIGSQPSKPSQSSGVSNENQQLSTYNEKYQQSQFKPRPFDSQPKPENSQPIQGASKFPPVYTKPGPACCSQGSLDSQSSQDDQKNRPPQFGGQNGADNGFSQKEPTSQDTRPAESISSFPGVSEAFGGPRKPPSFDATGYHY